jgi:hypothetical protein
MADGNSAILRYAFAAVFIAACLYDLQLGLKVAGVYLAGISLYGWYLGKIPLVDLAWNTTGYLSGAAAKCVSAVVILISMIFFLYPGWVIAALAH